MTQPSLVLVRQSPTIVLATWGRVQIGCWQRRIERTDLQAMFASAQQQIARLRGEKLLNLSIVDLEVSLPDEDARKLSTEMMHAIASGQEASATVLEGEGFRAGAARAAMAGMILLSRSPMPQKTFGAVDAAVTWLASRGGLDRTLVAPLTAAALHLRKLQMHGAPISTESLRH